MMKTFTKFGCCVTADAFNCLNKNRYSIEYNYVGTTIENILPKTNLKVDEEDIISDSGFAKRCQQYAFCHEAFESYLGRLKSDYFIFDFGDERLPCQKWCIDGEESMVPITWNTYRTGLKIRENKKNLAISDWHLANRVPDYYEKNIKKFIDIIRNYYDDDHIIYVGLRMSEDYINRDSKMIKVLSHDENPGIDKDDIRVKQQKAICFAEKVLLSYAPNIWKITAPDNVLADQRHHFSVHPLHYHHTVYEYLAECIALIADYDNKFDKKKLYINMDIRRHMTETKLEEVRDLYNRK